MELFSPIVGVLVQLGSGMLGIVLATLWMERKHSTIRETLASIKGAMTIWGICWTIGITELCIRFI